MTLHLQKYHLKCKECNRKNSEEGQLEGGEQRDVPLLGIKNISLTACRNRTIRTAIAAAEVGARTALICTERLEGGIMMYWAARSTAVRLGQLAGQ